MDFLASFRSDPRKILADVLRVLDLAVILILGLITYYVRHGDVAPTEIQAGLLVVTPIVLSYSFQLAGLYNPRHALDGPRVVRSIMLGAGIGMLILLVAGYLTKLTIEYSRIWLTLWGALTLAAIPTAHFLCAWIFSARGLSQAFRRRTVVIGSGLPLAKLDAVLNGPDLRAAVQVVERIDIADLEADALAERVGQYAKAPPDDFIVAIPGSHLDALEKAVSLALPTWANIIICPEHAFVGLPFQKTLDFIGGVPVFNVAARPLEGWQGVLKWVEDRVLATLFLLAASPLMALAALAIKLDSPGPVLFTQTRYGMGNRKFKVYKFRTMTCTEDVTVQQAQADDPRVTRVGRFLRRTSLDELPQLFNVLGGSMSLVGPRPHAVPHNIEFGNMVENYFARHRIKPGITGWAQVNGLRGEITSEESLRSRIAHDVHYIENWSLDLDLYIIARSALLMIYDRHAY